MTTTKRKAAGMHHTPATAHTNASRTETVRQDDALRAHVDVARRKADARTAVLGTHTPQELLEWAVWILSETPMQGRPRELVPYCESILDVGGCVPAEALNDVEAAQAFMAWLKRAKEARAAELERRERAYLAELARQNFEAIIGGRPKRAARKSAKGGRE